MIAWQCHGSMILIKPPDKPALLQAFLYANQWSAVNRLAAHREDDEHELRLISPWQSAVQVEDYQLYPVLKALLMPRISLLLADDVGLGKTIKTGLILSELFVRRRIRQILRLVVTLIVFIAEGSCYTLPS